MHACSQREYSRQKDLLIWPHLKRVHLPEINADIDLLIGTNVPEALELLYVIPSVDNGPYAIRTRLGWIVCRFVQR